MTPEEKSSLSAMRKAGRSYTEIAAELGISKNTVKTFCRRNGLTPEVESKPVEVTPSPATDRLCPQCGRPVIQPECRKQKKFCSDTCRNRWWNSHMNMVKGHAKASGVQGQCTEKADCQRPWQGRRSMRTGCSKRSPASA